MIFIVPVSFSIRHGLEMEEEMKELMIRIDTYFHSTKAPKLWEWIVLGILISIPFLSYFYGDTLSIVNYEVNFMGAVKNGGGWTSYYEYMKYLVESDPFGFGTQNYAYATYDFPMYIVLGIWGIPLWILFGAKGLDANASYLAKIYGKSVLLAALVVSTVLVYAICREIRLSTQQAAWGAFLFASSMCVFTAIGINGQTDILGIPFILLGLRDYIKHRRVWFVLWFMIAVMFKMYAFFIYAPLLLLAEKKLWKIGGSVLAVWALKVVQAVIFPSHSPAMLIKQQFELDIYNRLTVNRIPFVNGDVPTPLILIVLLCVYCYLHEKIESEEEFQKYAVWIPMTAMIGLFISFESSSYWYLHLCPYLSIMLVYNTKNLKNNVLFETVGLIAITLSNFGSRPWAFEIYGCHTMLLEKIFGDYNAVQEVYLLNDFAHRISIVKYVGALNVVFIVSLLVFVWMNLPGKIGQETETSIRGYAYVRLLSNVAVAYIPLILFVYNLLCLK